MIRPVHMSHEQASKILSEAARRFYLPVEIFPVWIRRGGRRRIDSLAACIEVVPPRSRRLVRMAEELDVIENRMAERQRRVDRLTGKRGRR